MPSTTPVRPVILPLRGRSPMTTASPVPGDIRILAKAAIAQLRRTHRIARTRILYLSGELRHNLTAHPVDPLGQHLNENFHLIDFNFLGGDSFGQVKNLLIPDLDKLFILVSNLFLIG